MGWNKKGWCYIVIKWMSFTWEKIKFIIIELTTLTWGIIGQDLMADGKINLIKIYTEDNAVDMMTKSVNIEKFKHCFGLTNFVCCWKLIEPPLPIGVVHLKLGWCTSSKGYHILIAKESLFLSCYQALISLSWCGLLFCF